MHPQIEANNFVLSPPQNDANPDVGTRNPCDYNSGLCASRPRYHLGGAGGDGIG